MGVIEQLSMSIYKKIKPRKPRKIESN